MRIKLLLIGFVVVSLKPTAVFGELDPLENYDNFNARKYHGCKHCIDSEKWIGFERGDSMRYRCSVAWAARTKLYFSIGQS